MVKRYGKEQRRSAVCAAMAVVLAFAFTGTTPMAFAEEEGAPEAGEDALEGAPEEDASESIESAFTLGDVTITCAPQEGASAAGTLAVGERADHAYLVTNEGMPAYVRLSSSLVCGDLVQPSELGVTDTVVEKPNAGDAEGAEGAEAAASVRAVLASDADADEEGGDPAEGDDEGESAVPVWRLAEDGWWYRNLPLAAGEVIEVHVAVEIPFNDAWVQALSTGAPTAIEESMSMGAVQARNMTIDLEAERPWGSLGSEAPDEEDSDEESSEAEDVDDEEVESA